MVLVSPSAIAGSVNDLSACANAQEQKKFEEGIEFCTRALNAPRVNASDQAYAYQRRARIFFAQRKYDEAIADFSEVIRLKPRFAENYADRARAYVSKGEGDKALADLEEAVRLDPANIRVRIDRGNIRHSVGKLDLALADFDAVIRAEPRSSSAFVGRARIYLRMAKTEEAMADLNEAVKWNPGALNVRGRVRMEAGRYAEAIADFDALIRITPTTRWVTTAAVMRWRMRAAYRRLCLTATRRSPFGRTSQRLESRVALSTCASANIRRRSKTTMSRCALLHGWPMRATDAVLRA